MIDKKDELRETANQLASKGKGLLALDESTPTIGKRLAGINIENTVENRQAYRGMLLTTLGLGEYISGIILFEETLYQTKSKSGQDPLNFPIRLNNKLAHLNSLTRIGSYAPTQQAIDFKNEINKEIDKELSKLYDLFNNKVTVLNKKVKDSQIDLIQLD